MKYAYNGNKENINSFNEIALQTAETFMLKAVKT